MAHSIFRNVRQARTELASYRSPIGIEFPSRRLAGRWAGAVDGPTVRRGQPDRSRANHDFTHTVGATSLFIYTNVCMNYDHHQPTLAGYR
jgi:hypothetical protein